MDSVSPKFSLFADAAGQLQMRGMGGKTSRLVMATYQPAVPLPGEWIEAFWCPECQRKDWYHVWKTGDRHYEVKLAPRDLWMNATGVVNPHQNPSVSEYSFRSSRRYSAFGMKGFHSLK